MLWSMPHKNGHVCHLLEEETLVEDLICETHNLSGSLYEDRNKLMEAMKNYVDINALVERCCWEASRGELEGESFLEECITLKEGMVKIKEIFMNLLSDRDHLLMMSEMYHRAFKKEAKESERIHSKWEATYDSFKRTQ